MVGPIVRRARGWLAKAGVGVLVLLFLASFLVLAGVVLVIVYLSWPESHAHLDSLEADAITHCNVPGAVVSRTVSNGTRRGIGFGGTSPSEVVLDYQLTGDPASAIEIVQSCAIAAGWSVTSQSRPIDPAPSLIASKSFRGGWQATAYVGYGRSNPSAERLLTIFIESDAG